MASRNLRRALRHRARRLLRGLGDELRYRLLFELRQPTAYAQLVALQGTLRGAALRVDACTACQLSCPACSTGRGKNRRTVIGWGYLRAADFARLCDDNPHVRSIELSNWGEIFLNPELRQIIAHAHRRDVRLKAGNGVNLNTVDDETLRDLVRLGFRHISVSIDGASHETYRVYRRKGSFRRVLRHIERINYYKLKYGSPLPRLSWQFVVFGHNEHELPTARRLAAELQMEFRPKLNHTPTYSPVRDLARVRREAGFGAATRDEYTRRRKRAYSLPCSQLWDSPQINWDGALLGCCVNKFGHFGNVFDSGLSPLLAGERLRYARRMVVGLEPPRDDIPCNSCPVYRRLDALFPSRGHGRGLGLGVGLGHGAER